MRNMLNRVRLAIIWIFLASAAGGSAAEPRATSQAGNLVGPNPTIRVLLINSVTSIQVIPKSEWVAKDPSGKALNVFEAGTAQNVALKQGKVTLSSGAASAEAGLPGHDSLTLEPQSAGGRILIKNVPFGVGWWWASAEDRTYESRIEIFPGNNGKLEVVTSLPLEEYLRGVVPTEIGADSPLEALKAQAVAARTESMLALMTQKYAGGHYDICSDVECQAYSGVNKCNERTDEAVRATRGIVLLFEGKPISAYYASNCGGHTEDIRNVWPERAGESSYWGIDGYDAAKSHKYDLSRENDFRRWLAADPDVFCNPSKYKVPGWTSKNFRWTRDIPADQLTSRVAIQKDVGRIKAIRPVRRGPSGRLIEAEFVGEKGSLKVGPELKIRQMFEPPLKSAAFVVDIKGPAGRPDVFIIQGAGWGHGVGMCQTGAIVMAEAGRSFKDILKHYYKKAILETLYK